MFTSKSPPLTSTARAARAIMPPAVQSINGLNREILKAERQHKDQLPLPRISPFCRNDREQQEMVKDHDYNKRRHSHGEYRFARDTHLGEDNPINQGLSREKVWRHQIKHFVYLFGSLSDDNLAEITSQEAELEDVRRLAKDETEKAYQTGRAAAIEVVVLAISRTPGVKTCEIPK